MTELSEVYSSFLSKIDNPELLTELTNDEILDELLALLKVATSKFSKCKKSLKIIDENNFESELSDKEIEILASLMTIEYLKPFVLSTSLLKPFMSDKDWKNHSPANLMKETRLLSKALKAEVNKAITEYTYMDYWGEKQ